MVPLTMTETWVTMGSTIASFMFICAIICQYYPYEVRRYFKKYAHRLTEFFYLYIKISIHDFTRDCLKHNEAYVVVEAYLDRKPFNLPLFPKIPKPLL